MHLGQAIKHLLSTRRGSQTNAAAIREVGRTFEQTLLLTAIDQFHHGVVLQPKGFSSIGNRRRTSSGNARDRQQELVLLRMQAGIVGRILANQKKFSQLMAKRCEGLM
jgi:hypothetical protein